MTLLDRQVVLAPMAGGPSTVGLATAVTAAGGFAFLAGAYLAPGRLRDDIVLLQQKIKNEDVAAKWRQAASPSRDDVIPKREPIVVGGGDIR